MCNGGLTVCRVFSQPNYLQWLISSSLRKSVQACRLLALRGTLLPTDSTLFGVMFYLAGGSVAVDYSTVSIVWTPQSTKFWKWSITLHKAFRKQSQRDASKTWTSDIKQAPKKHCKSHKLASTKNLLHTIGDSKNSLLTSPFFRMSTMARQHHLVAGRNIAICGQFVTANATEIHNKIEAITTLPLQNIRYLIGRLINKTFNIIQWILKVCINVFILLALRGS